MAGHSHWANIQHKKGIADAKRGKLWSKLARAIITAAKNGGGDPAANLKLRYAIDKAKEGNMPRDTIEKAVLKGTGELGGSIEEELTYEGFGPGGVAILVDVLTDNRNRTSGEVRKILERAGGKLGSAGNVAFLFDRKGVFAVESRGLDEDTVMSAALDAGADDFQKVGDHYEVTCDPASFTQVQQGLAKAGIKVASATVTQIPKQPVDVDAEMGQRIVKLMEQIDDHDDVQTVYCNANFPEAMLA